MYIEELENLLISRLEAGGLFKGVTKYKGELDIEATFSQPADNLPVAGVFIRKMKEAGIDQDGAEKITVAVMLFSSAAENSQLLIRHIKEALDGYDAGGLLVPMQYSRTKALRLTPDVSAYSIQFICAG